MQWMLVLALICQDAQEAFKAKPSPAQQQLAAIRAELHEANTANNELRSENQRLKESTRKLNDSVEALNIQIDQQVAKAASANVLDMPIDLVGFINEMKSTQPFVQWVITTSPACSQCHPFVNALAKRLSKWKVGEDDDCQFKIVSITDAEWNRLGYSLPRCELFADGVSKYVGTAIPYDDMASMWNNTFQAASSKYNGSGAMGLVVKTVPVKPFVRHLLKALNRFLDGGTLTVSYKPRPGVIKDYLTIQQGQVGLRLPANTSFVLTSTDNEASIKFVQPTVQVRIPIRGNTNVNSMTLTPEKFAVQLPWMIDPEVGFTNPPVHAAMDSDSTDIDSPPYSEVAEAIDDSLFGAERSGKWSTVKNHYNATHPFCEACGTPLNGNVHHVQPFHLHPELELDPSNLIRLCRYHHFAMGHLGNWKNSNPNIRADAAKNLRLTLRKVSNWSTEGNPFKNPITKNEMTRIQFER